MESIVQVRGSPHMDGAGTGTWTWTLLLVPATLFLLSFFPFTPICAECACKRHSKLVIKLFASPALVCVCVCVSETDLIYTNSFFWCPGAHTWRLKLVCDLSHFDKCVRCVRKHVRACTHTSTRTSFLYFNLCFGPSIIFHHEPLLPLPCRHSNTIATSFARRALDLNQTQTAPLSPLHLSSVAERIVHQTSWHADRHLLLRHAWPRISSEGEERAKDECWNAEMSLPGQKLDKVQAKWCNTSTAHTHPSLKGNMYPSIGRIIHCS